MYNRKYGAMKVPAAPPAPRQAVVDVLHGVKITDPYRWLESCEDEATEQWTRQHNDRTDRVMEQIPERNSFRKRLAELLSGEEVRSPEQVGEVFFYTHRRKNEDQARLCCHCDGGEHVLVDPNENDPAGLISLDWWYPSPDGRRVAYGCSSRGDEWSTLRVIDVQTRQDLPLAIERARGASVAWQKDGEGFYYTRYPRRQDVAAGEEYYHRKVFHHRLGDNPERDPVIFGHNRPKEEMYQVKMCDDGSQLLLTANEGWARNEVYVRDEAREGEVVPVITGKDALFFGDIADGTLFLLTNHLAPKYRVIAVDPADPDPSGWVEVIAEREDLVLKDVQICDNRLIVSALDEAIYRLFSCRLDGSDWQEIPLPVAGTVSDLSPDSHGGAHFVLQSFLHSPAVYHLKNPGQQPEIVMQSTQHIDPEEYVVDQVFYESRDGTTIPMFVVHHAETSFDRPRPTLLTAYGGFNISRTPAFSPTQIPWLERGGVFALANIRGGSEYGEKWHRAGMLECKQNVFDDFTAAAEHLIDGGYTDSGRLGIMGASNGGLLVGAALTQRPELFSACVCGVPLLDMLRFHKFLIAGIWIPEYGSADDPEQFAWLYEYSPYHRVRDGEEYPAVYLHTALSDSRVHPMHARKMAARLEEATASDRPVLLHVESDAGHGAGKPVHKIVESQARILAFLCRELDLLK